MLAHDFLWFPVRRNSRKTSAFFTLEFKFLPNEDGKKIMSALASLRCSSRLLQKEMEWDLQWRAMRICRHHLWILCHIWKQLSPDKHDSTRIAASLTIFSTGTIFIIAIVCYTREPLPLTLLPKCLICASLLTLNNQAHLFHVHPQPFHPHKISGATTSIQVLVSKCQDVRLVRITPRKTQTFPPNQHGLLGYARGALMTSVLKTSLIDFYHKSSNQSYPSNSLENLHQHQLSRHQGQHKK